MVVFEDLHTIQVCDLKRRGMFQRTGKGFVELVRGRKWSFRIGEDGTGQITAECLKTQRKYLILLIAKPSNLGVGKLWFFVCPFTRKKARKLYLQNGIFRSRTAVRNGFYEQQIRSRKDRSMFSFLEIAWSEENEWKKWGKKTYRGKPTKAYLNYLAKEEKESRKIEKMIRQFEDGKGLFSLCKTHKIS